MQLKIAVLVTLAVLVGTAQATQPGSGLVDSIVPAPIGPDGNVAGQLTDIVIDLAIPMDPHTPGLAFSEGDRITVTLPEAFTPTGPVNVQTPFTPGCAPPFPTCSTVILLQGWPQHPTGFPPPTISGKWSVTTGATPNELVVTALTDLVPAPPLEPGTKQIHLFLSEYVNPHPGHYTVQVETSTGWSGSAPVHIIPNPRPRIAITSLFGAAGNPNTIFQTTTPNLSAPHDYNLLLWERGGGPAVGVQISGDRLVKRNRTVGHVSIEAPAGAVGQSIMSLGESFPIVFPISGRDAGRMTARFMAGSMPGTYRIRLRMEGGDEVTLQVDVE